jgi:ABC-type antimicrobial peptide transport system ATPase subunit
MSVVHVVHDAYLVRVCTRLKSVHHTPYTIHSYTIHSYTHTPYAILIPGTRVYSASERTLYTIHHTPYTHTLIHHTPYTIHSYTHTPYTIHSYTIHYTHTWYACVLGFRARATTTTTAATTTTTATTTTQRAVEYHKSRCIPGTRVYSASERIMHSVNV